MRLLTVSCSRRRDSHNRAGESDGNAYELLNHGGWLADPTPRLVLSEAVAWLLEHARSHATAINPAKPGRRFPHGRQGSQRRASMGG